MNGKRYQKDLACQTHMRARDTLHHQMHVGLHPLGRVRWVSGRWLDVIPMVPKAGADHTSTVAWQGFLSIKAIVDTGEQARKGYRV